MDITLDELIERFSNGEDLSKYHGLSGINEKGETVIIYILDEKLVTETLQSNDWVRTNIYYKDGTSEELYRK